MYYIQYTKEYYKVGFTCIILLNVDSNGTMSPVEDMKDMEDPLRLAIPSSCSLWSDGQESGDQ